MSGEEKPLNPCDLFLPKDYEDDLGYRQQQPEINTDTSDDDEDGHNSRQTSPVDTTTDQPNPPNPFALLQNHLTLAIYFCLKITRTIYNIDKPNLK